MKTTSNIRIIFNKSGANTIYRLAEMVLEENEKFSLSTSSRAKNPDTLLFKREVEYTEEMVHDLVQEFNEALFRLYDSEPIHIESIIVEKVVTTAIKYSFAQI